MTEKEYLEIKKTYYESEHIVKKHNRELCEKYPWLIPSNRWSGKKITDCIENMEQGYWPGNPEKIPAYDYEYTELDEMPDGWRIAFGERMCEEIQKELEKFNYVDKFRIEQIKEKYGGLRFYTNSTPIGTLSEGYEEIIKDEWGYPEHTDNEYVDYTEKIKAEPTENPKYVFRKYKILDKCLIQDIIRKYEDISYETCIICGEPAEYISKGWISPYCKGCAKKMLKYEEDILDGFTLLKNNNLL